MNKQISFFEQLNYFFLAISLLLGVNFTAAQEHKLPKDFIYVHKVVPDIALEIRYCGANNFMGKPVDAYWKSVAILTKPAAQALIQVQQELKSKGYRLKIFDAYRPQSAVNQFVKWAKDEADTINKNNFYPEIDKKNLFALGYIASRSGHSRGSTVDLTIIDAETGQELDMGSPYDFFGSISSHNSTEISKEQKENRLMLKHLMMKNGFRPYPEEWWHYTLRNEPYPDTYFDFPVE
ncbi:M15 family metallopeptidase [Autumnicola psychrophila]|uniref:D-alanyl-D-alanine dipeptidase n=1 Tax=Autumnicola psychrophila TaxID=3075592 RepID=A0ABU3DSA5_9FLAO|nr:M15 family metallopeptidase [Zunongwangia sp. F225]MDT0686606.1 M15 family metallopeptidase [Zunongwangia sp. F225]